LTPPAHGAADQHAGSGVRCPLDQLAVLGLERGVGDLKHIEDAHGDVIRKVRQHSRHPYQAHLSLGGELVAACAADGSTREDLDPEDVLGFPAEYMPSLGARYGGRFAVS
jgi:hypothetical protein